jgi:hypothetical protein
MKRITALCVVGLLALSACGGQTGPTVNNALACASVILTAIEALPANATPGQKAATASLAAVGSAPCQALSAESLAALTAAQ